MIFNYQQPTKLKLTNITDENRPLVTFPINPEKIEIEHNANWVMQNVPGLSMPYYQFVSGGSREVSFTLPLYYAFVLEETKGLGDVHNKIMWLESLTYPVYSAAGVLISGPPILSLDFGEMFRAFKCVMLKCKISAYYLFDPVTLIPKRADVDITLGEVITKGVSRNEIYIPRGGGTNG